MHCLHPFSLSFREVMRPVWFLLAALAGFASNSFAIVDFQAQIAPILRQNCLSCHGAAKAAAGLHFESQAAFLESKTVVPGKPEESILLRTLETPPGQPGAMPPGGPQLSKEQLALMRAWILEGARWPEGIILSGNDASSGATRLAQGKAARIVKERAEVQTIYDRIAAAKAVDASAMQPYKVGVPNTTVSFEMTPIPAGDFTMGTPDSEAGRSKFEGPQHKVHVDAFWMQTHEVTWDEYRLFMFAQQAGEVAHKDEVVDGVSRPTRPYVEMSFGMGINGFPAISMTQHAANKYAEWLSAKTGEFYRLPTEAEWEYACRAGTTTAFYFGDDPSKLGEYAWFDGNSDGKYQKVATKKPNAWGLYDMLGNVMEWTLDQYAAYPPDAQSNPWVKSAKAYPQVARGGSWNDPAKDLRCAARVGSDAAWKQQDPQLPKSIWYHTDAQWLGFRVVRPAKVPTVEELFSYWNNGVERD
jgi:formylglycine-generating enzyme required for sulfatase activity/mono/diheme cytochrome c family protein